MTSLGIGGIKFSKNVANKRPGYHTVYIRSTNQAPIAAKDMKTNDYRLK
jgi:glutamate racemase